MGAERSSLLLSRIQRWRLKAIESGDTFPEERIESEREVIRLKETIDRMIQERAAAGESENEADGKDRGRITFAGGECSCKPGILDLKNSRHGRGLVCSSLDCPFYRTSAGFDIFLSRLRGVRRAVCMALSAKTSRASRRFRSRPADGAPRSLQKVLKRRYPEAISIIQADRRRKRGWPIAGIWLGRCPFPPCSASSWGTGWPAPHRGECRRPPRRRVPGCGLPNPPSCPF